MRPNQTRLRPAPQTLPPAPPAIWPQPFPCRCKMQHRLRRQKRPKLNLLPTAVILIPPLICSLVTLSCVSPPTPPSPRRPHYRLRLRRPGRPRLLSGPTPPLFPLPTSKKRSTGMALPALWRATSIAGSAWWPTLARIASKTCRPPSAAAPIHIYLARNFRIAVSIGLPSCIPSLAEPGWRTFRFPPLQAPRRFSTDRFQPTHLPRRLAAALTRISTSTLAHVCSRLNI